MPRNCKCGGKYVYLHEELKITEKVRYTQAKVTKGHRFHVWKCDKCGRVVKQGTRVPQGA